MHENQVYSIDHSSKYGTTASGAVSRIYRTPSNKCPLLLNFKLHSTHSRCRSLYAILKLRTAYFSCQHALSSQPFTFVGNYCLIMFAWLYQLVSIYSLEQKENSSPACCCCWIIRGSACRWFQLFFVEVVFSPNLFTLSITLQWTNK